MIYDAQRVASHICRAPWRAHTPRVIVTCAEVLLRVMRYARRRFFCCLLMLPAYAAVAAAAAAGADVDVLRDCRQRRRSHAAAMPRECCAAARCRFTSPHFLMFHARFHYDAFDISSMAMNGIENDAITTIYQHDIA